MAWSCHYATGCFVAFLGDIFTLKSGWSMKKIFCCPVLELFHCLPLWKTVLFVSSRAFSLSTPTFSLSTPVENSKATWKKATKCNKCSLWMTQNGGYKKTYQIMSTSSIMGCHKESSMLEIKLRMRWNSALLIQPLEWLMYAPKPMPVATAWPWSIPADNS